MNNYLQNVHDRIEIYRFNENEDQPAEFVQELELPGLGSVGDVAAEWDSD